ncbi:MAG: alpha-glucan family phosphorylase [Bacteroidales bacterium]|nr:alpha-glucan family phosphorylase [Bacteroidales bacterium]
MIENVKSDYIFEVSWEVCNKNGGIYAALATKAVEMVKKFNDHYIFVGPDILKDNTQNPFFVEDTTLFPEWKKQLKTSGLPIRIGRWKDAENAISVLIDFTTLFSKKNDIFAQLWEKYGLDSISGQWDYIEPALFGYAAGMLLDSFTHFQQNKNILVTAQFHDWLTGAGILYLKEHTPEVATVFVAHATVLGRAITEKGWDLYGNMKQYEPVKTAYDLGVAAKFSLERNAASNADVFTTVSNLTATECEHFLNVLPDVITPSGVDLTYVPKGNDYTKKRNESRQRLKAVAEGLMCQKVSDDALFVLHSGRYEFVNRGINQLIDALDELKNKPQSDKEIIVWIMLSNNQLGARNRLLKRIEHPDFDHPVTDDFLTHSLFDEEHDKVLSQLKNKGLWNTPDSKVKVIFTSAYLDGKDGIFNMDYLDVIIGMDVTVFPSIYEPWGNAPECSLVFSIPTITTQLTGFGKWLQASANDLPQGAVVLEYHRNNYDANVKVLSQIIADYAKLSPKEMAVSHQQAYTIATRLVWNNFMDNYYKAWEIAEKKRSGRTERFVIKLYQEHIATPQIHTSEQNEWRKVLINPIIPRKLSGLLKLSKNLWWSWHWEAIELFKSIDAHLWDEAKHNPITLIESLTVEHWNRLEKDSQFVENLLRIEQEFDAYMQEGNHKCGKKIGYFSMEYGLDNTLKIYSGGLGILAGDYLKEASDCNVDIVGVGLLYRYGYFQQRLSANGDQIEEYVPQKFSHLPLIPVRDENGKWITITNALPGRHLTAKIWRVDVGRVPLFLLDTDIDENIPEDRSVTHQLYGGDLDNRLKQELLLGVGGIRALNAMDIHPDIYHCNEGHAAFIGIERMNLLMRDRKLTFGQAKEVVRASSLFTTHTPVPAGHDSFPEDLLRTYISHYPERLNLSWNDFMNLGRFVENDPSQRFSMSVLAINLSQEVNGVSKIHGRVSREMFKGMFPGYFADEIHIGHVTNGVHYYTWTNERWQQLFKTAFGNDFLSDQSNEHFWEKIGSVSDEKLWEMLNLSKQEMLNHIVGRITQEVISRQDDPKYVTRLKGSLNAQALTIGFARRFATYKRAGLLFNDLERLNKIINNPMCPVRFIFAGKAHPHDEGGKSLIRQIVTVSKMPDFVGKIVFVENYDMELAKYLISGVDIWMNTPTRPLEASGTSGEKAVMNGTLNLSVLDGWWAEGYQEGAGWALPEQRTYTSQQYQDELDADTIYRLIEKEIAPLFYDRNEKGVPTRWLQHVRNTFTKITPRFTMKRMLDEYRTKYYSRLENSSQQLCDHKFENAIALATWKQRVEEAWNQISVLDISMPDLMQKALSLGENFEGNVVLDLAGLTSEDVGIEVLFANKEKDQIDKILFKTEMTATLLSDDRYMYKCNIPLPKAGVYDFALRMYPKNKLLPYRMGFKLVKYL